MPNAITWFEIPVSDFDRAKDFYASVYDFEMTEWEVNGLQIAFMPYASDAGVGGAIVKGEGYEPSDKGTMVYLDAGDNIASMLERVERAGGSVVTPKTLVSEDVGYMAVIRDTEGNRVALHSRT